MSNNELREITIKAGMALIDQLPQRIEDGEVVYESTAELNRILQWNKTIQELIKGRREE